MQANQNVPFDLVEYWFGTDGVIMNAAQDPVANWTGENIAYPVITWVVDNDDLANAQDWQLIVGTAAVSTITVVTVLYGVPWLLNAFANGADDVADDFVDDIVDPLADTDPGMFGDTIPWAPEGQAPGPDALQEILDMGDPLDADELQELMDLLDSNAGPMDDVGWPPAVQPPGPGDTGIAGAFDDTVIM